jgi:glycosyltransferase involved in cell wall biosynthesis
MPTTLAAFFSGMYCKKNKIPFVIDVIDIWPQSLYPLTRLSFLLKFLCYPWQLVANYTYGLADLLLAESKKYLETAGKHNKRAIKKYYYLGVDKNKTQELIKLSSLKLEKPTDEIWICYGGQLGTSYGFEPIIEALKALNKNQIKYKFWFVGDGEKRPEIEEKIRENNLNAEVTGFVNYTDFLKYLSCCDIAINIFKENTKVVHSYKFNDYVASGLFVLNSLKGETSEMVESYEIGFNFDFGANNLTSALLEVCKNLKKYQKWKTNCNKLIKEKLDKKMIYSNLTKNMLNLIK